MFDIRGPSERDTPIFQANRLRDEDKEQKMGETATAIEDPEIEENEDETPVEVDGAIGLRADARRRADDDEDAEEEDENSDDEAGFDDDEELDEDFDEDFEEDDDDFDDDLEEDEEEDL